MSRDRCGDKAEIGAASNCDFIKCNPCLGLRWDPGLVVQWESGGGVHSGLVVKCDCSGGGRGWFCDEVGLT
jgi:hypothetical protein